MNAAHHALHLPSSTRTFVSRHHDETIDYVARRLAPHRMDVAAGESIATDLCAMPLGPLDLIEIGYGANVRIAPATVDDCYLVHTAIAGSSHVMDGDTEVPLDADNLHILSPGQASVFHLSRKCRHLAVRIPVAIVDRELSTMIDREVRTPLTFAPATVHGSALAGAWRRLLAHIVSQARATPAMMQDGPIAAHYSGLLVAMLLDLQPSNYHDRLHDGAPTICPRHVHRARALIEESASDTITISDLAAAVKVSPRSLQNGFRQFLGVTPGEYVRNHRLALLHAALETAPPESSVTDLMLERGITNFGRYAGYYRRRYGCAPSATLRKMGRA